MSVDETGIETVFGWMCDGARPETRMRDMIARMCRDLNAANVHVERFALFLYTLHPLVRGRRYLWQTGEDVAVSKAARRIAEQPEFQATVAAHVMRTGETVRVRLHSGEDTRGFTDIAELRDEGMTDYLIVPLAYTNGETHAASWSTRAEGGFSDAETAALQKLRPALARLAEIHTLRLNAVNVLSAFLGADIASRILAGQIERGSAETIEAVILFFDIADYTRLSNENPPDRVIGWLNTAFDIMVTAVEGNGGEVLKFLGDGLIAIFPTMLGPDGAHSALLALADADARLSGAAEAARREGGTASAYRAALHIGSVMFGNVGARHRLDFTAIGPAVNLASRLVTVGSETGERWVCSEPFAALSPWPRRELGERRVKGFDKPVRIFALDPAGGRA